jgi:hypothetical protein
MIQFQNLTQSETMELMSIISKNTEKSELDKFFLYTQNTLEKARIFMWCHRFLYSIQNLGKENNLRKVIESEIIITEPIYRRTCELVFKIEKMHFNQSKNLVKLWNVLNNTEVDSLIDAFALLTERTSLLSMSRLKGFVLEGNSGKEYKKIFDAPVDHTEIYSENDDDEPEFEEENNDEKEINEDIEAKQIPESEEEKDDEAEEPIPAE